MVPARDIIFHRLWFTRYHFLMESDILWTIGGRINLKVCLNSLFIALQNEYHEYLVFCYPTFCNLMVTPDSRKIREQPRIARRILSVSGLPVVVYIPWLYPEKTEKLLHFATLLLLFALPWPSHSLHCHDNYWNYSEIFSCNTTTSWYGGIKSNEFLMPNHDKIESAHFLHLITSLASLWSRHFT